MSSDDGKRLFNGFKNYVVSKDGAFMRLPPGQKLYFKGKIQFKSIKGVWTIMGSRLGPESKKVRVFCPTGYSYLCLESTTEESSSEKEEKQILQTFNLGNNSEVRAFLRESTHVALVEALPDAPWNLFLSLQLAHVKPNLPLFEKNKGSEASTPFEDVLDIRIMNQNAPRLFNSIPEWDIALRSVELSREKGGPPPKVLVAGGKGVGKSSFAKYLLNSLTTRISPVYFVNLDPGQGEFDPPGFVSVHLIKTPILGPNFTHMNLNPKLSYFVGDVNMTNCSKRFLSCVARLARDLEDLSEGSSYPWILNTMGFNKGLGLVFMVDIIRIFRPSTVVNILSRFPKKNYELDFSPSSISAQSSNSWFTTQQGPPLQYNVLSFPAVPETPEARGVRTNDTWGIPESRKLRDIVLLSYLGSSLFSQKDFFSRKIRSLQELTPIAVPWSDVSIQLLHVPASETKHALDILNASLVSLGVVQEWDDECLPVSTGAFSIVPKSLIAQSLGLGLIRSVDRAKKCFYLLTSLSGPSLASVNVLSAGAIHLPEGCFNNPSAGSSSNSKVPPPYVQPKRQSRDNPLDKPWRRYFKPASGD